MLWLSAGRLWPTIAQAAALGCHADPRASIRNGGSDLSPVRLCTACSRSFIQVLQASDKRLAFLACTAFSTEGQVLLRLCESLQGPG